MRQSAFSRLYSSLTRGGRPPRRLGQAAAAARAARPRRIRQRLRARNLYDSGRGPLDRPPADDFDHARPPDRAHARRHLQRPRRPADGRARQPLRPQRPARRDVAASPTPAARAEPARGQPRADDARRVHAGDDAEPARRRLDPVRGARLVQPRRQRAGRTRGRSRSPTTTRGPSDPMEIQRTRRDPSADPRRGRRPTSPPTRHWWDASQIYGSDPSSPRAIRTGEDGKLRIDADRPAARRRSSRSVDLRGVAGNCWVGLALLHALFMLEHNAICDRLQPTHPTWTTRSSSRTRGSSTRR